MEDVIAFCREPEEVLYGTRSELLAARPAYTSLGVERDDDAALDVGEAGDD